MNKEIDEDNLGTEMLSRIGLSTIPQYLCFQKGSQKKKVIKVKQAEQEQKNFYVLDEEQVDLSAFKKEFDDIYEK